MLHWRVVSTCHARYAHLAPELPKIYAGAAVHVFPKPGPLPASNPGCCFKVPLKPTCYSLRAFPFVLLSVDMGNAYYPFWLIASTQLSFSPRMLS